MKAIAAPGEISTVRMGGGDCIDVGPIRARAVRPPTSQAPRVGGDFSDIGSNCLQAVWLGDTVFGCVLIGAGMTLPEKCSVRKTLVGVGADRTRYCGVSVPMKYGPPPESSGRVYTCGDRWMYPEERAAVAGSESRMRTLRQNHRSAVVRFAGANAPLCQRQREGLSR